MIRKTQVNSLKKLKNIEGKRKTVYDINRVTGRVTELVNLGLVNTDETHYDSETKRTVTLWKAL